MRKVLEERTESDGTVTRLERLDYTRRPLSTSGDNSYGSDRLTVEVTEYEVTTKIRPNATRPMFLARTGRFKTLRKAKAAFDAYAS